jgi:hypothetical protein
MAISWNIIDRRKLLKVNVVWGGQGLPNSHNGCYSYWTWQDNDMAGGRWHKYPQQTKLVVTFLHRIWAHQTCQVTSITASFDTLTVTIYRYDVPLVAHRTSPTWNYWMCTKHAIYVSCPMTYLMSHQTSLVSANPNLQKHAFCVSCLVTCRMPQRTRSLSVLSVCTQNQALYKMCHVHVKEPRLRQMCVFYLVFSTNFLWALTDYQA